MAWRIPPAIYKVYPRNTLVSTDIELRFHPLVSVTADMQKLALFQSKIREEFPAYQQLQARSVIVDSSNNIAFSDEVQHSFGRIQDGLSLIIGAQSVRVSTVNHTDRAITIGAFIRGMKLFTEVYGAPSAKRLGARYVNVIDRDIVAKDLKTDVSWTELVKPTYFSSPGDVVNLAQARFLSEIRAQHPSGGEMALRFGLTQERPSVAPTFRFDTDRYTETVPSDLNGALEGYTQDIFSLFHTMIGDRLLDWMSIAE